MKRSSKVPHPKVCRLRTSKFHSQGSAAPQSAYGAQRRASSSPPRPQKPAPARPVFQSAAPAPSAALPDYRKGDMLEHKAFGRGMVLSTQRVGGDTLLEIAFDGVGTKRLMLKFTAQHMKKL